MRWMIMVWKPVAIASEHGGVQQVYLDWSATKDATISLVVSWVSPGQVLPVSLCKSRLGY